MLRVLLGAEIFVTAIAFVIIRRALYGLSRASELEDLITHLELYFLVTEVYLIGLILDLT